MKAALAEKQANDEGEARRREEQVQLKDQYKDAVNVWKNKNKVGALLWPKLERMRTGLYRYHMSIFLRNSFLSAYSSRIRPLTHLD